MGHRRELSLHEELRICSGTGTDARARIELQSKTEHIG